MIATVLDTGSLPGLARLLKAAGLPADDLVAAGCRFLRFDDQAGLAGYAGIEGAGPDRLVRSFVVPSERRGHGLGTKILAALEHAAAADGAANLYLLTTTAAPFFRRHGYAPTERAAAPPSIAGSAMFRSLCPADAAFLSKRIA